MGTARAVRAILTTDLLRLLRDRFLLGSAVYVAACALAMRWVVPWLHDSLLTENGLDITPYVPLGISYFVVVNSGVITGILGGFLLLEAREERVLHAMRVTPAGLGVHLGTLAAVVVVAGIVVTLVLSGLVGVGVPGWGAVVASATLGAPSGLVMTLVLAIVAANKVEAFAVMKLTSILGLLPVVAWFLPEPLQYAAGVVPAYWACKIWWLAAEGSNQWPLLLAPGLVVNTLWIRFLLGRFLTKATD